MTKELPLKKQGDMIEGRSYSKAVEQAGGAVPLINRMRLIAELTGKTRGVDWEKLYETAIADDTRMGRTETQ